MNAPGDKVKFRASFHSERGPRMVRQHEDGCVVWRFLAPPALPAVVGPGASDGSEHVTPKNPGADTFETLFNKFVVDPRLDSRLYPVTTVHLPKKACVEEPFHQFRAPDAERILKILAGPGPVAVDGNPEALHSKFRHCIALDAGDP